jgi:8-oxo-dGTP pyrophosphatase MutT (NUDIX family)
MIIKETAGVIPIYQTNQNKYYLIVQWRENGFWNFPKGQRNINETLEECAKRELKEETGITNISLLIEQAQIVEFNTEINGQQVHKKMTFFPWYVKNTKLSLQEEEILDYLRWTYEECLQRLSFDDSKRILTTTHKFS